MLLDEALIVLELQALAHAQNAMPTMSGPWVSARDAFWHIPWRTWYFLESLYVLKCSFGLDKSFSEEKA